MAELNLLRVFSSLLFSGGLFSGGSVSFPPTPVPSLPLFSRQEATVVKAIVPFRTGQIRFQGSWWSARCQRDITLQPGERVSVVGRQNITLLVEPVVANRLHLPTDAHPTSLTEKKEVQLV